MTDDVTPPADVPVTDLNAADSAAMLVSMSAAYKAANPPTDAWRLDAETANKQLAEMADSYKKSTAPKLPAADQTILGESADVPREFETTTWPVVSTRNKLSVIEELRQVGIPDPGIARVISGEPYSKEDYDAAVRWRDRVTNDPVLSKELLDGSSTSKHVITAMAAIIALGPPAEAK
jgi:hypothetical protein